MRNNLFVKLMGAFLLVIAIGGLVIAVSTSMATRSAFTLYTTRSSQAWATQLAPELANYYAQANNWEGVDALLQSELGTNLGTAGRKGQGRGAGTGNQAAGSGNDLAPGIAAGAGGFVGRLILVDAQGTVISDSQDELTGTQISPSALELGVPIMIDNNQVGTIIATPNNILSAGTPAGDFIASVNKAIVLSALAATVIALILGSLLFFQITSPLRQLKKAASAIAQGNLGYRVKIKSQDEFGDLGKSFNTMAENLSSAETKRKHLMADIAHELRTPLAAIQGTLEGMQDGVLPLDEEQINALHGETTLLNRLVGDLRLLSLAEAGQLKLEKQEIEPGALIQQIVDRVKPQADQKKVRLQLDLHPGIPAVWIDADRFTQVMNNLITNALRYTPENGTISIQASYTPDDDGLKVSVTDSGPGIEVENLPYVFDRFYRADKSRTRSSGGSGLGLAIVKQLVEAHGGSITVLSPVFYDAGQAGYGTTMKFTLPVKKPL